MTNQKITIDDVPALMLLLLAVWLLGPIVAPFIMVIAIGGMFVWLGYNMWFIGAKLYDRSAYAGGW